MIRIDKGKNEASGIIFNITGDLAVIVESVPLTALPGLPCSTATLTWLNSLGLGSRLSSLHVIYPNKREDYNKKVPLRELRKGWHRVSLELKLLVPNVKRVLVISGSTLIQKVIMPGVEGSMKDFHGTIFSNENLEIVHTFE